MQIVKWSGKLTGEWQLNPVSVYQTDAEDDQLYSKVPTLYRICSPKM